MSVQRTLLSAQQVGAEGGRLHWSSTAEDSHMTGAMRKMAVYLGLVEDDRYDEYDEYEDYEEEHLAVSEYPEERGSHPTRHEAVAERSHVTSVTDRRSGAGYREPTRVDLARITTLHPRTYNEARTVGEHFREGIPVIMNLTEMVDSDAKRLVDFAAGLIFGLHGSIDRVTNKVFLLSPANVEVTAEDKARIAEGGFFNQS